MQAIRSFDARLQYNGKSKISVSVDFAAGLWK